MVVYYLEVQVVEEGDEEFGILVQAFTAAAHHVHHQFPLVETIVLLTNEEQDEGQLELHKDHVAALVAPEPGVELEAGVQAVEADLRRTSAVRIFLFSDRSEIVAHVQ